MSTNPRACSREADVGDRGTYEILEWKGQRALVRLIGSFPVMEPKEVVLLLQTQRTQSIVQGQFRILDKHLQHRTFILEMIEGDDESTMTQAIWYIDVSATNM